MKIDKAKLNKLKKDLKGKMNDVAFELNVPASTVSRVLNGTIEDDDTVTKVISACVRMRNKIIADTKKVENLI